MAHSLHRNQPYSATLSKKLSTANGFYDDVFAGPAKVGAPTTFSSRVEDYCEIFGASQASRGSSIPVLDLPIAKEREASIDVRSTKLDYSRIFSGFGDLDFAAPDEELFAEHKGGDRTSSDVAWTPAKTGSPLEGSDVLNRSKENEAAHQSLDSEKQFNMSYHRTSQTTDESMNRTTYIAEFDAVPGYSCLIDGSGSDTSVPTVPNDIKLNVDFSEGTKERKPCRRNVSDPPPYDADKQTSDGDAKFQSRFDQKRTYPNDNLFNACEARTQSSKLEPPNPNKIKDDCIKSTYTNFRAARSDPEGAIDDCSSTSSDEEVDPNSAAAASAAAVRKAIENARVRIRIARESMERKKAGLQGNGKLSFKDGLKFKEKWDSELPASGTMYKEKVAQVTCERVEQTIPVFFGAEMHNATEVGQIPGTQIRDKLIFANRNTEKLHEKNSQQTQVDHEQEAVGQLGKSRLLYNQVDMHKSRAATIVFDHVENKMVEAIDAHEWKEEQMVKTNVEEPTENIGMMEIGEEAHKREEIENATKGAQECVANKLETATGVIEQKEIEEKMRIGLQLQETREIENEEELNGCHQQIEKEEIDIRGWMETEVIEIVDELKKCQQPIKREDEIDLQGWKENETLQKRLGGDPNHVEVEEQKSYEQEENERTIDEVFGSVEHGNQPGEISGLEENEKKQKDAPPGDCMKELPKVLEKETVLTHDCGKSENLLQVDHPWEENENLKAEQQLEENEYLKEAQELEENEEKRKEFYQMGENKNSEEVQEWEETERTQRGADETEEKGQIKVTNGAIRYDGMNFEVSNDASEQDQAKNQSRTQKIDEVFSDEETGRTTHVYESFYEPKENANEWKPMEAETGMEEEEMSEEARLTPGALENREINSSMNEEVEAFFLDANRVDLDEIGMNLGEEATEHDKEPELVCNMEDCFKKWAPQSLNNKHAIEAEVAWDEVSGERQWVENGKKLEAGYMCREKEMSMEMEQEINSSQITEGSKGSAEDTLTSSQITEGSKESADDTLTIEGRETQESLQKEEEVEKEQYRRMNEEKERERERERERMVVERAIREARERAFAEAREKAEKAAAERATIGAQKKVMDGAGERLNKASKDKSLAEKASVEAKLRAQRAAVERATAEARERALEKALSGKGASGAREQAERFAASKKDPHHQGSGPLGNSRYSSSSNNGVPYATGFDEAKDEATQRSKPMSDRHQRTVERAAKVLEEKNMRDRLAQKEQAERNRLAEALDGDVKRWSSGKDGNLRALLATLQYILGPDSGWQPIPLTDIITASAIKKAYRKATLCVHPDKLQQRGATIQQKYICEKVFDLLQEAWNKFNSEER